MVKNLPVTYKAQLQSLDREDPPGEGKGYPLQYSCLENSIDSGAWQATIHGVARRTQKGKLKVNISDEHRCKNP